LRSLLGRLTNDIKGKSKAVPDSSAKAKASAFVLSTLFGDFKPEKGIWDVAVEVLLDRNCNWESELVPKVVVCWLGKDEKAILAMLEKVKTVWGSNEEMKSGFEGRRTCEFLFLVSVARLPCQAETPV